MWLVKGSYSRALANCIFIFTSFYVFHQILNIISTTKSTVVFFPPSNCSTITTNQTITKLESKIILASNINESYRNIIAHDYPEILCLPNDTLKCLPAFVPYGPILKTSNKYKLSACVIPKSMSTIITSFMCYLNDEKEYRDANLTFAGNFWEERFCGSTNENSLVKDVLNNANATIDEWQLFSVVRDPIERLLSAFVHLCVIDKHDCFNCSSNFSCFIEKAYYQAYGFAEGKDIIAIHVNMHFFPQNWYCQFGEYFANYKFIHYKSPVSSDFEKMVSKIVAVLKSRHIIPKSSIKSIQDELLQKQLTVHATINNPLREKFENELKTNKETLKYFVKMYYQDYVLFKFQMPEYFKDILDEI